MSLTGLKYRQSDAKSQREMDVINSRRRTSVYWRQKIPVKKIGGKYEIAEVGASSKLGSETFGQKISDNKLAEVPTTDAQEENEAAADAPGKSDIFAKPKTPEAGYRNVGDKSPATGTPDDDAKG